MAEMKEGEDVYIEYGGAALDNPIIQDMAD
jgi:hypothetical protein